MTDQAPLSSLEFPPLHYHEFHSLPGGFEYQHEISEESNSAAFDIGVDARDLQHCVICGRVARQMPSHPLAGVQRVHIIDKTEDILWNFLKDTGFVPSLAKSVKHEPRNGISLCDSHHSDFDAYAFFIRWVPSHHVFVLINFSQEEFLEKYHGKTVVLDPNHNHSPFPALFLIHEMRTRGFNPWCTDRPIPQPLSPTYVDDSGGASGGMSSSFFGDASGTGASLAGGSSSITGPGGNDGAVSSDNGGPPGPPAGVNQQYLVLSNPFQDPELLESMHCQWQQLPNWKSATVEGLTWQGTAEENVKQYINLVGVSTP